MPAFLYGTAWKEEQTSHLTRMALTQGFRAIDTANQRRHYFEAAVGETVEMFTQAGSARRSELFLQTKFTYVDSQDRRIPYDPAAPVSHQVLQSCASSLEHLRTKHIDSYLLHGPSRSNGLGAKDWEVWQAMEGLQRDGKVSLLGISNVTAAQLSTLLKDCAIAPVFVQNRCYARTGWDREVRALCRARGVIYQGFSLLTANQKELKHPTLLRIANECRRTPAQVVFRFAMQVGMIPLTGTSSTVHMREDLDCFTFELEPSHVEAIERLAMK